LAGAHEAELVQVEGRLLSHAREPLNELLVLTAAGGFFNVVVEATRAGEALRDLAPGSTLAVTGVVYQRRARPGGNFDLLLRSGDDVRLVKGPGLTRARALTAAGAAAALALAAFGWVAALRRQVAQKARLVREVAEENERRLTQIIDSLAEAMFALDGEGRVLLWNSEAERLCGRARAEALGRGLVEVWPRLDTPALRSALELARAGGGVAPFDIEGASALDPATVLEARVFAFAGGATVLLDDVTAARATVHELRRARTAAEAAAQAKAEFLANMSHEIRTPLNAVIGLTGPLLETQLDAEQRELVATVRSSADTLLALVNGILDFSKIDAGKLELESAPFVLRACVEDAVRLVADRAARQRLELGCEVDPQVPAVVVGDLTRVRQVLVNLADNAVKFTPRGEVTVRVLPGASEGGRQNVRFEVCDTGLGIPRHAQARLFQPFAQLDASTTRRFGGTGLGLALCQRLVDRMGGKLTVDSSVDSGSTFAFELPLRAASGPVPEPFTPAPTLLAGRRALLVARGEGVRRGLALDLCAWGLTVSETGDVEQALAWNAADPTWDVAVVDLDLDPRHVPEAAMSRGLPVVGFSWGVSPPSAPEPAALRLRKPVRLGRLLAALREALDLAPMPRPDSTSDARRLADLVPLRILVAEDNPVNQKVALLTLRGLGYEADLAANGQEALVALRRQPYDVVLMDVQMPEMDGLEAARRIRAEWPGGRPRILALSASAFAEDRERCRAAGMDGFVAKPMDLADLRRALLALAHGAAPASGAETAAVAPEAAALEPALDRGTFETLRALMDEDGDGGFGDLCNQFLTNTAQRLSRLARAGERGEAGAVAREAHTLLGSCATFGARPLARLLARLEQQGRERRLDGLAALVAEAESEFARVREALEALRRTLAS
jgi:signal transduction histidine kinase/CheY-like chemotaxis protein